jgi:F-type H+-transporting ATPase subunit gamma
MSSLKDIKNRIKSVRNIQQITKAMKMVAASRIRKAEDQLKAARPYADKLKEVVFDLTAGMDEVLHPLMEVRPVKNVAMLIVSSDKGLCGAYNNNLLRIAWKELDATPPHKLVTVGAKVGKYLKRRAIKPDESTINWEPEFELAQSYANLLTDWFVSGEVDQVVVYYTQPVTSMTQETVREVILPLQKEGLDQEVGAVPYEFEPSADAALNVLLPRYVRNVIFRILMEAKVAELAARLKAMSNATDNADKLADELTLQFFRLRQEAITTEILEICSGAEAMAASS